MDFPHDLADLLFVYLFPKMAWTGHFPKCVRVVSKIKKLRYPSEERLLHSWFLS